jgi:phage tail-like protein
MSQSTADQSVKYPLVDFNFRVDVDDETMSFTEVSGLTQEYQSLTYRHGLSYWEGEKIARFRFDTYSEITLKKGIINDADVTAIYEWLSSGDKKTLSIHLCDEEGSPVVTWNIKKAIVINLEAPSLVADSNEVAIDTITLMAAGISISKS